MEYEKIILEMLMRIKALEDKVASLTDDTQGKKFRSIPKKNTQEIKEYITESIKQARANGREITLTSGQIHKQLGLSNAMAMVCNAMYACKTDGDEVLFKSPSGYSATLKIRYNPNKVAAIPAKFGKQSALGNNPNVSFSVEDNTNINPNKSTLQTKKVESNPLIRQKNINKDKRYIDKQLVWRHIIKNEGKTFFLQEGGEFTYAVGKDYLALSSGFRLPKHDIEAALEKYPFKNIVPIQHLRCASNIFSLLVDQRIKIYSDSIVK